MNEDEWNEIPEFHVAVDATDDPPCVSVWGEIDLATCAAFRDALFEAADTGNGRIAVDFTRVTFMGSTGIRELVRTLERVDRIEVRRPTAIVRRALETASVGNGLVIVD